MTDLKVPEAPECPYCKKTMEKFDSLHLDWGTPFLWVCFNNECAFFVKGWKHMMENYGQVTSYRHMVHPDTGTSGVIPAFSFEYLKNQGRPAPLYPKSDEEGGDDV